MSNDPSVPLRLKVLYGIGQCAESVKNFSFGTMLLLYYNQVLGLSGTLSGIAVAIAVGFDAITDPAVGSWSDGFRHRLGRRHFFMFASILPLGLTYFGLFWPPEGLPEWQLFLWFTTFAVLSRTALTFFHVPFLSLSAEMTPDYQERTHISALRQGVGMIGSLVVVVITWNVLFVETPDNEAPQLLREPYFAYAIVTALLMTGLMFVSTFGTLPLIPKLPKAPADVPPFSLKRVYVDIYQALKNPAFFALFWGTLLFAVFMGVHGGLSLHTKTFYWQLDTGGIQIIQYAQVVGGIAGILCISYLHRVLDKRLTLIVGVITYATMQTGPFVFELLGWMPKDPQVLTVILGVASFLGLMGIINASVSGVSMMGDIADEHELHHGRRQEGVYFGSHNFAVKCTTAVGNLIAGVALDVVNFPEAAVPGQVPQEVLTDFGLLSVGICVMAVAGLMVFWPYNMSRERHAEVRQALAERGELKGDSV